MDETYKVFAYNDIFNEWVESDRFNDLDSAILYANVLPKDWYIQIRKISIELVWDKPKNESVGS